MIVVIRRVLIGLLALVVAITVQLVIVNRVALPGGGEPDLVLLVVAALAVSNGPMTGVLAGFFGGLALDIAPPGGHLAGEYALVFCLVGYVCGRLREDIDTTGDRVAVTALTVMAAGVAGGEVGKVVIGLMVSAPQITGPIIKHVLPGAVLYDLVLCPFVLWLISLASPRREPVRGAQVAMPRQRARMLAAPQTAGVFRLASAGTAPRLRLGSGRSSLVSRISGGSSALSVPAAARPDFGSHGGGLGWYGKSPSKGWLRQARAGGMNVQRKSPGKGWLRPAKPVKANWYSKPPSTDWLKRSRRRRMGGRR
jgi:rod shape-determining protein MreD